MKDSLMISLWNPVQEFIVIFYVAAGDAFFKAGVSLISEVPKTLEIDGKQKSTEPLLLEFINNLLATLLYVPVSIKTTS